MFLYLNNNIINFVNRKFCREKELKMWYNDNLFVAKYSKIPMSYYERFSLIGFIKSFKFRIVKFYEILDNNSLIEIWHDIDYINTYIFYKKKIKFQLKRNIIIYEELQ